jgi:hypothetical protein
MQTTTPVKVITHEVSREIDIFLEGFYEKSIAAAKQMVKCNLEKTQARSLETLTLTTSRFSEIINYVKRQIGKETKNKQWQEFGPELLTQLDTLEHKAEELGQGDARSCLDIKLQLARGWSTQVICHYLYEKTREEDKKKQNGTQ